MRSLGSLSPLFFVAAALSSGVHANVYQSFSELNTTAQYDFIVIGSGPGGSTVASRLTEDPKVKVLLIEAGGNNEGVLDLQVPAFNQQIPSTYTWNYTTAPSATTNNRSVPYPRGFVLGGTSSINGMVYSRGAAEDYNAWAKITGDDGWRWDALWPFIKRNERLIPPAGGRNTSGEFDPALHGYNGSVPVTLPPFGPDGFNNRCLETARLQNEFNFNLDMNSGRPIGLAWSQRTVGNGERSSAATSYLSTAVRQRPNLSILINTYVTRVLPVQAGQSKELVIRKVEVGNRSTRTVLGTLTASKEVILSAGAFGTPQILLNSGIGDAEDLRAVGVTPVHSLPDVGRNMADHIGTYIIYTTTPNNDPPVNQTLALEEWVNNRTGILTDTGGGNLILFSRIPSSSPIWKTYSDPSSGPNTPHAEHILVALEGQLGAYALLLNPTSRGSIAIRSSNPFEDPIINLGFLQSAYDVLAVKEMVLIAKRFFSGPQWSGLITNATSPNPDTLSDDEWSTFIRDNIATGLHAVGTAVMSKSGAEGGVVDPHLRVKGVSGLRIVDASVIPKIPAAHIQVPTYLIAERAVTLIRSSWK